MLSKKFSEVEIAEEEPWAASDWLLLGEILSEIVFLLDFAGWGEKS